MKRNISACLAFAGAAAASGTLEFPLSKRDASGQQSNIARGVLWKRQDTAGTVEESVYDVLPWSLGGAYYTNSKNHQPASPTPDNMSLTSFSQRRYPWSSPDRHPRHWQQ